MSDLIPGPALEAWLRERHLLGGDGPMTVSAMGEGHSNLTFLVRRGEDELVLRRPPAGPLLPTAHDVVREATVMSLVAENAPGVPVPAVLGVCDDASVIGVPFTVMSRAPGVVVRSELPEFLAGAGGRRARHDLGVGLATVLGRTHSADWRPFVEAGIGRPSGYLERQLRRWTGQREGIVTAVAAAGGQARALPDYDLVRDWLLANLPQEGEPSLVHGDYKLDNVIVAPGAGADGTPGARITAVVDWEMATVGDPRADLGYLLSFWPEPGESVPLTELVTTADGFPTREEIVAIWEEVAGRPAGDTRWFVALAVWKLAILLEASYHRWLAGTADDPFFARLDEGVPALLARARELSGA